MNERFTFADAVNAKVAEFHNSRRGGEDEFCGCFPSHDSRGYVQRRVDVLTVHVHVKLVVAYSLPVAVIEFDNL
jgi:hypothetical protein